MFRSERRGPDARRTGHGVRPDGRPQDFDRLLVGVGVRRADVRDEAAGVGHHIVLRPGLDLRHRDSDRTQQLRFPPEAERTQPRDVFQRDVEGVHPLAACRMAAFAVRRAVQHHQPPFSCGGLHAGRFADQRHVDPAQRGQQGPHAVLAHALLFGRDGQHEVEGQLPLPEGQERLYQTYRRSSRVVASEAVEAVALDRRHERIAGVRSRRTHRVVVRVQKQRRTRRIESLRTHPDVVRKPFGHGAVLREVSRDQLRGACFVARERGCCYQPFQQLDGICDSFIQF